MLETILEYLWLLTIFAGVGVTAIIIVVPSMHNIGPNERGLVIKKFGRSLADGAIIAFKGEAGYQAELLSPGWRFRLWILYNVRRVPLVQIPAGKIGLVQAQIGEPLPTGAKLAEYKASFGDFGIKDLKNFLNDGGQQGIQAHVLIQGTPHIIHPVAFLVRAGDINYGLPLSDNGFKQLEGLNLNVTDIGLSKKMSREVSRERSDY